MELATSANIEVAKIKPNKKTIKIDYIKNVAIKKTIV
jgi:hypothetical protein